MPFFERARKMLGPARALPKEETRPLVGRTVWCGVCNLELPFTRCWRRVQPMRRCSCCGATFSDPVRLHKQPAPACPRCAEPLECPDFDYGICDGCGSKYEIMEGTKPGLLPNRDQRLAMERHGRAYTERK